MSLKGSQRHSKSYIIQSDFSNILFIKKYYNLIFVFLKTLAYFYTLKKSNSLSVS
jgi:hypothetical protein